MLEDGKLWKKIIDNHWTSNQFRIGTAWRELDKLESAGARSDHKKYGCMLTAG